MLNHFYGIVVLKLIVGWESFVINRDVVVMFIATVQIVSLLLQTFWRPSFNPFAPIHRLLYTILRAQGPVSSSVDKSSSFNLYDIAKSLYGTLSMVLVPVMVAVLSAAAQYYVLRYYSDATGSSSS